MIEQRLHLKRDYLKRNKKRTLNEFYVNVI